MLRNKGFWGQNGSFFDLVYLENNKHFEKRYWRKVAWNHALNKIQLSVFR